MVLYSSIVGAAGLSRKQLGLLAAIGAVMALALEAAALAPVLGALAILACRGRGPRPGGASAACWPWKPR